MTSVNLFCLARLAHESEMMLSPTVPWLISHVLCTTVTPLPHLESEPANHEAALGRPGFRFFAVCLTDGDAQWLARQRDWVPSVAVPLVFDRARFGAFVLRVRLKQVCSVPRSKLSIQGAVNKHLIYRTHVVLDIVSRVR